MRLAYSSLGCRSSPKAPPSTKTENGHSMGEQDLVMAAIVDVVVFSQQNKYA